MITVEQIMDFLVDQRVSNLPPQGLADVFDRLIWCLSDNGDEVLRVRDRWLAGTDFERARIALAMKEALPCDNREELVRLLLSVEERWPDLRDMCDQVLENCDQQYQSK